MEFPNGFAPSATISAPRRRTIVTVATASPDAPESSIAQRPMSEYKVTQGALRFALTRLQKACTEAAPDSVKLFRQAEKIAHDITTIEPSARLPMLRELHAAVATVNDGEIRAALSRRISQCVLPQTSGPAPRKRSFASSGMGASASPGLDNTSQSAAMQRQVSAQLDVLSKRARSSSPFVHQSSDTECRTPSFSRASSSVEFSRAAHPVSADIPNPQLVADIVHAQETLSEVFAWDKRHLTTPAGLRNVVDRVIAKIAEGAGSRYVLYEAIATGVERAYHAIGELAVADRRTRYIELAKINENLHARMLADAEKNILMHAAISRQVAQFENPRTGL